MKAFVNPLQAAAILAALCLAAAHPVHAQEPSKYGMEDLTALAEQEGWQEMLAHMNDIAPRQRKGPWKKLLGQAAGSYVEVLAAMDNKWGAVGTLDSLLLQYPILKKDKTFMQKRAEIGITSFGACFSNRYGASECSKQILAFAKQDPKNSKLAFEAGKLTRLRGGPGYAVPLFAIAVKDSKQLGTYCADEQLWLATSWALVQNPDSDGAKTGRDIAFSRCFKQLKSNIIDELLDGSKSYAKNTCAMLGKKKALTKFQSAWCKDLSKGS